MSCEAKSSQGREGPFSPGSRIMPGLWIPSQKGRCTTCMLKMLSTNIFGTTANARKLLDIFNTQGGVCPYTGRAIRLGVDCELDHKVARSKGGTNEITNLQWVYGPVNRMKFDLSEE